MIRTQPVCLVLLLALYAAPASAQTCLGRGSFAVAPFQVSGGAGFTDGANGFDVGFAGGSSQLFAGATLGRTSYTEIDESSTDVGAFVGGGPVMRGNTLQVCGVGGIAYGAGPNVGVVDTHTLALQFGASIGVAVIQGPSYSIVPAFGGSVVIARLTASVGDDDQSETETFGSVDFGVGLIFNERVSVAPRIGIPVGRESNDPVFGISLAINFGR
jgi:hypothetical protein